MINFASVQDVIELFRALTPEEQERTEKLIPIVSDRLRQEAFKVGRDIDEMLDSGVLNMNTVKSVTVDIVARAIMTPTDEAPVTQFSQGAAGYTFSGTYLVPGGGIFIKRSELSLLGLRRQRMGVIELYDSRNSD